MRSEDEEVDRLSEVDNSTDEGSGRYEDEEPDEEEHEMHDEHEPLSAREQARRDAFRASGARGRRRHALERNDPYAPVVVGYLAELYTSPRFGTVRRGTRA